MQSYDIYAELKHTNNILMELPSFRQMLDENLVLAERAKSLKIAIEYLESKNRRLSKKASKYKSLYKESQNNKKCVYKIKEEIVSKSIIDLVSDDDEVVEK